VFRALFSSTSDEGQPLYNGQTAGSKVSFLRRFHCISIMLLSLLILNTLAARAITHTNSNVLNLFFFCIMVKYFLVQHFYLSQDSYKSHLMQSQLFCIHVAS